MIRIRASLHGSEIRRMKMTPDQTTETILKTGLIQLQTIEETNQKYVRIEKTEV